MVGLNASDSTYMPDEIAIDPLLEPVEDASPITPAVVICPHCARSLVHEDGALRLATAADTQDLTDDARAALRSLQRDAVMPPRRNLKR